MRDHLLDLVGHTHDLGVIDLVRINGTQDETTIEAIAEDRSVVVQGKFLGPVADFIGMFGMPNLDKLKILLNLQEYRENAKITVTQQSRNGATVPVGMHFENAVGDFKNDYRFMTQEIVAEQVKTAVFKGVNWDIQFEPTVASIQRLKMQAQANSEQPNFKIRIDNSNLLFSFGDHSTHAGEFTFHSGVSGNVKRPLSWPVSQVLAILGLVGNKVMMISDSGAMQITVDSGLAIYNYILPAQSK
jgi:hypothetical protein